MIIGVPKERKVLEKRVALTPAGVTTLVNSGHTVLIESSAGEGSGFSDYEYQKAGAVIVNQQKAWSAALVIKVKEPIKEEFKFFRKGQILFTFLHLASNLPLAHELREKSVTAIDYATLQLPDGSLPLLRPMSEISGRLAIQKGAELLGGIATANVLILGAGTVGIAAAETSLAAGAKVTLVDSNPQRIEQLAKRFQCMLPNKESLRSLLPSVDLLIGAALIPGAKAPRLVTKSMVKTMRRGAVIVDVSIDQGGNVETSHATNHNNPTFVKHGVIHYCVSNMPGSVPHTSTLALTNATLPYIIELADNGFEGIYRKEFHQALTKGVNVHNGHVVHKALLKLFNEK